MNFTYQIPGIDFSHVPLALPYKWSDKNDLVMVKTSSKLIEAVISKVAQKKKLEIIHLLRYQFVIGYIFLRKLVPHIILVPSYGWMFDEKLNNWIIFIQSNKIKSYINP